MPIIQEAFFIPPSIAEGLATGRFVRNGGVVRIAKGFEGAGELVKFLDPVPLKKEAAEAVVKAANIPKGNAAGKVAGFVAKNQKILIIGGVAVLVVTAIGVAAYVVVNNSEPQEMKVVRQRFDDYLTAVKNGTVDFLVVDQLAKALDDLKALKNYDKLKFQLTPEEFSTLIGQISMYTQKLIKDNDYACTEEEKKLLGSTEDPIFDLRSYLEVQKNIIVNAA